MKKREQEAEFLGKKKSNKPPPFKNIKVGFIYHFIAMYCPSNLYSKKEALEYLVV